MFQRCVGEEVLVLGKSNSRDCEDLAGNTSLINFPLTSLINFFSFSEFASSEETMAISFSNQPYAGTSFFI